MCKVVFYKGYFIRGWRTGRGVEFSSGSLILLGCCEALMFGGRGGRGLKGKGSNSRLLFGLIFLLRKIRRVG